MHPIRLSFIFDDAPAPLVSSLLFECRGAFQPDNKPPNITFTDAASDEEIRTTNERGSVVRADLERLLANADVLALSLDFSAPTRRGLLSGYMFLEREGGCWRIAITPRNFDLEADATADLLRNIGTCAATLDPHFVQGVTARIGVEVSHPGEAYADLAIRRCHKLSDAIATYFSWVGTAELP